MDTDLEFCPFSVHVMAAHAVYVANVDHLCEWVTILLREVLMQQEYLVHMRGDRHVPVQAAHFVQSVRLQGEVLEMVFDAVRTQQRIVTADLHFLMGLLSAQNE